MTDELCAADAYLTTCKAVVREVREDGVVLDRTVCSCGLAETVKSRADGETLHVIEEGATAPAPGTAVTVTIDWDRRHVFMRTHTALHALSGVVFTDYGARVTGGNMDLGAARMDFELDARR